MKERPTIMIVDDETKIRRLVARNLEDFGFDTVPAADGFKALEILSAKEAIRPDLILMDIMMPGMDGLECAQKIRAMEIIDELEPVKRGIYGGAVGYFSYAGEMDMAIAIRTAVIKNKVLYAQAAAGIVADSVPEFEWKETEMKARAVLRAAEEAEFGLQGN